MNCKRLVKRGIASLVDTFVSQPCLPGNRDPATRILLYHSLQCRSSADPLGLQVVPGEFERHMGFLRDNGYTVIRLSELVDGMSGKEKIGHKTVAITFDDGFLDTLNVACPVLEKFGYPATVFISSGIMRGNVRGADYWDSWEYMTRSDVKRMSEHSLFDIGSHGVSHVRLSSVSGERQSCEIRDSRAILEEVIGKKVGYFSYPHGCFDARVKKAVEDAGYNGACSSFIGMNRVSGDVFALKRTEISGFDTVADVAMKLRGAYDWLYGFQKLTGYR